MRSVAAVLCATWCVLAAIAASGVGAASVQVDVLINGTTRLATLTGNLAYLRMRMRTHHPLDIWLLAGVYAEFSTALNVSGPALDLTLPESCSAAIPRTPPASSVWIAVVDRGDCSFATKAYSAYLRGARFDF